MFCCCFFSLIIHGWLSFHAPVQVIHMFLYSLTCGRGREIPLYRFRIIYSWRVPWYHIYSVLCVFLTRFSHPFLKFELMTFWFNRAFHENLKFDFPLKLCEFIPNWPVNICNSSLPKMWFATRRTCASFPSRVRKFWTLFRELWSKVVVQMHLWRAPSIW